MKAGIASRTEQSDKLLKFLKGRLLRYARNDLSLAFCANCWTEQPTGFPKPAPHRLSYFSAFDLLETVTKKSENSYKQTTTRQRRNQNKNNSS
jgi:hypothetical protein